MNFATETTNELKRLLGEIKRETRVISLGGLTSISAKAFVLAELQRAAAKTFVVVADTNKDLDCWECDLRFFNDQGGTQNDEKNDSKTSSHGVSRSSFLVLPSFETDVYSGVSPHAETLEKRALALWNLSFAQPSFLVASAKSLISRTVSPAEIKELGAILRRDEDFSPDELIEKLVAAGYVRAEPLASIGEFSVRGGILDVWSPTAENPVRIEFFGDTVDSIREFDAETQLSIGHLKEISIAPMREFAATDKDFRDWSFFARERFADEKSARALKDRTDFADEGESFSGWEFMISLVNQRKSSVFDYLKDAVFVVDEPLIAEQTLENYYDNLRARHHEITEAGEIGLKPEELFLSGDELKEKLARKPRLELRALGAAAAQTGEDLSFETEIPVSIAELSGAKKSSGASGDKPERNPLFLFPTAEIAAEHEIGARATRKFHGNLPDFAGTLKSNGELRISSSDEENDSDTAQSLPKIQNQTLFVMQSNGIAERLTEILRDYAVSVPARSLLVGDLSGGFEIPSLGLTFYTEADIFGEKTQAEFSNAATRKAPTARQKSKIGAFISDFRDLKIGDYVVHVDHGISRFEGLQTLDSGGVSREFMLLVYAENTKLFVPVERLDLVSRYSSGEAAAPSLDRLGGLGWQKTKAKAKRAMRDMADELLKLYAERKLVEGFAFSADAPWQKEFEDAFPYQLTADQATAIVDLKTDMEAPVPMDRLVVGDVGYGKPKSRCAPLLKL